MRRRHRLSSALALSCVVGLPILAVAQTPAKPRTILILPFATTELTRDEQWIGASLAESLALALVQAPGLVQIDSARLKHVPQPESWDDQAALQAARTLKADVALYGVVKRSGTDLVIQPQSVEVKGERGERVAVEPQTAPDGALLDRLRDVAQAYVRALKVPASETDVARVRKWASPTSSPRAWEAYVRGRLAAARGGQEANESAVDALSKAIELDPQFVAAQYQLGVAHQVLSNRWKAAAQFRASTQLDPMFPEPYKSLGDLFVTAPRRLFDQAIEAYNNAIALRPFYADAWVGLGDAKAGKGDVDGAVGAYQKALGFNPVNAKVHVSLGKLYYSEKNLYYESVTAYKKAIDLDPGLLEARMGLAEVYEDKGLYQDAIVEYKKVVDADQKNTGALYNLALVYEKVDPKESITLWERYIELASRLPSEKDWVDVAKLHLRKLKNQVGKEN
jgi:tetratricopeptide (TPR) repeat protein